MGKPAHVRFAQRQLHLALRELAEIQQVRHQLRHHLRMLLDAPQLMIQIIGQLLFQQRVHIADDERQGRAQFVADVGEEGQFLAVGLVGVLGLHALFLQRKLQCLLLAFLALQRQGPPMFLLPVPNPVAHCRNGQQDVQRDGPPRGIEGGCHVDAHGLLPFCLACRADLQGIVSRPKAGITDRLPRSWRPCLVVSFHFIFIQDIRMPVNGSLQLEAESQVVLMRLQAEFAGEGQGFLQDAALVAGRHPHIVYP